MPPPTPSSTPSTETTADASSRSALSAAKRNIRYLYDPSSSPTQPGRFRTRALLRALRYTTIFIFWRLVRYAKYIAIGSLVAAVGATAFGSVVSGAAFVIAPTGIAGTIVAGSVWGVGRWAAGRLRRQYAEGHRGYGEQEEELEERRSPGMREELGPGAMPW
jgi:hypothetical protein